MLPGWLARLFCHFRGSHNVTFCDVIKDLVCKRCGEHIESEN